MSKRAGRVLITNDDGIDSPGIEVLWQAAKSVFEDVCVCAPAREHSWMGHAFTTRSPVGVSQKKEGWFAIDGTPADCVNIGARQIMKDSPPDLVLSGVNIGSNLGEEVSFSGTVSAALEGGLLGIKSIAFSQGYISRPDIDFGCTLSWAPTIIERLFDSYLQPGQVINVNLPALSPAEVKGLKVTHLGHREVKGPIFKPHHEDGRLSHFTASNPDRYTKDDESDLKYFQDGYVVATPIMINRTDFNQLQGLSDILNGAVS